MGRYSHGGCAVTHPVLPAGMKGGGPEGGFLNFELLFYRIFRLTGGLWHDTINQD
jgi:hypothetical protein